jgi:hypothetical protein
MATVNLGSIKFKWKGTYSGATAYTVDDVVEYNGSSYICILASTGNLPTNATYFEQMAQAGVNGTNGTDLTTTLTTQGDLVYRDGSGLQRLGAGTAGQVLQTGGAGANPSWITVAGGKTKKTHWWWDNTQASIPDASSSGTGLQIANYSFNAVSNNPHFILDFSFFLGIDGTSNNDSGDLYCAAWIETSGGTLVYPFGFKKTGGFRANVSFRNLANQFFLEETDAGQFSNTSSWGGDRRSYNGVMGNQATEETQPVASSISAGDALVFKCHLGGSSETWYNRTSGADNSHSRSWFKLVEYDNAL